VFAVVCGVSMTFVARATQRMRLEEQLIRHCKLGFLIAAAACGTAADGGSDAAATTKSKSGSESMKPSATARAAAGARAAAAAPAARSRKDAGGRAGETSDDADAGAAPSDAGSDAATAARSDVHWIAEPPRKLSWLVGPTASYAVPDTELYGSDMASSFTHGDKVIVAFGDTFTSIANACDGMPRTNNDMMGTLPIERGSDALKLDVVRGEGSTTFHGVKLFQGGASITLSDFKIPLGGFSDGHAPHVIFQAQAAVSCDPAAPVGQQGCPEQDGVECVPDLSFCEPAPVSVPNLCEPQQPACLAGGCKKGAACVDTHSSQYDGTARGVAASVMSTVYFSQARSDDLATYDVVGTWQTSVLSLPVVRTVSRFSGSTSDADYSSGYGELLIWGRSAMHAEQGRQARVYFATLPLPLTAAGGELHPRYYAGSDEATGEPMWTDDQARAHALAMDGQINGDASEPQGIVTTTTVSWLGEPVNRWVMMYGGDLPTVLLADPAGTRAHPSSGSVMLRFAEHPWGPWSPAVPHLPAGDPNVAGDAYGPGGVLFHPDCRSQPDAPCAAPDPLDFAFCNARPPNDLGRLYSPAIIDAYTRKNDRGGLDITWAISTWVPYGAHLMESSIIPE